MIPPTPRNQNRSVIWAVYALLFLVVGLVFVQTIDYDFVNFDDAKHVRENPVVARGLTVPAIVAAFTQRQASNWVPLTWISFMVDYQLHGFRPGGYHLTNVLLHAAAAMLLSLIATLYPAWKASKTQPAEALRYE